MFCIFKLHDTLALLKLPKKKRYLMFHWVSLFTIIKLFNGGTFLFIVVLCKFKNYCTSLCVFGALELKKCSIKKTKFDQS